VTIHWFVSGILRLLQTNSPDAAANASVSAGRQGCRTRCADSVRTVCGAYLQFATKEGEQVQVKVAHATVMPHRRTDCTRKILAGSLTA
jgi:hypothetical protein